MALIGGGCIGCHAPEPFSLELFRLRAYALGEAGKLFPGLELSVIGSMASGDAAIIKDGCQYTLVSDVDVVAIGRDWTTMKGSNLRLPVYRLKQFATAQSVGINVKVLGEEALRVIEDQWFGYEANKRAPRFSFGRQWPVPPPPSETLLIGWSLLKFFRYAPGAGRSGIVDGVYQLAKGLTTWPQRTLNPGFSGIVYEFEDVLEFIWGKFHLIAEFIERIPCAQVAASAFEQIETAIVSGTDLDCSVHLQTRIIESIVEVASATSKLPSRLSSAA